MQRFRLLSSALLLALTSAAAEAQHEVRTTQGLTSAGRPYVDVSILNTSGDAGQDLTDFIWGFDWWDYTGLAGAPEEDDFLVTSWPAGWGTPTMSTGLTRFNLRPSAPGSPASSVSFRVTYAPTTPPGDADPALSEVHFRDKRVSGAPSVSVWPAIGPRTIYPLDPSTALSARRLPQHDDARPGSALDGMDSDGGRVACLTSVQFTAGVRTLWCSVSEDQGQTWAEHVVASQPYLSTVWQGNRLRMHGDHLYAVWSDDRSGGTLPYFARSIDGGASWTETLVLPPTYDPGARKAIMELVRDPGGDPTRDSIYLLYEIEVPASPDPLRQLRCASSHDGGLTFSDVPVGATTSPYYYEIAGLEGSPGAVHLLFKAGPSYRTTLATSRDGGSTFTTQVLSTTDAVGVLACEDDTVAWVVESQGNVRARVSTDRGATFSAAATFGNVAAIGCADPLRVNVVQGTAIATWPSTTPTEGLMMSRTTDGGASWSTPDQIHTGRLSCLSDADVFASAGVLLAVRAEEVLVSRDAGATWDSPVALAGCWPGTGQPARRANAVLLTYDDDVERAYVLAASPDTVVPFTAGFPLDDSVIASRTAGTNPQSLTVSQLVPGDWWTAEVDLSATGQPFAVIAISPSTALFPLPNGDFVLIGNPIFVSPILNGPSARLQALVPIDVRGALSVQAVHLGAGAPLRFSNAIDLVAGLF